MTNTLYWAKSPFIYTATILCLFGTINANHGCKEYSDQQIEHIEISLPKILGVNPNKVGAVRIKASGEGNQLSDVTVAKSHNEEFLTSKTASLDFIGKFQEPSLLSSVDNSKRPSFPPIGNQGDIGSCVAWASTYYQATHEIGMLNGINNKTSNAKVLSPKWTYNILNDGVDQGLYTLEAYKLLSQNGAITIANFPYDNDYLAWDTNPDDWASALCYRMAPPQLISGMDGSDSQSLQIAKQMLINGHVLTFATYIDSWVFTYVKKDPDSPSNPFIGQLAASWVNGHIGGHCMTIVGYDDDIWIDINRNGKVDQGEKGAFLVANSWGTNWGNNGFIWIAYDAFKSVSEVPNGPNSGRVPAGAGLNSNFVSVIPIETNYKPSIVAQFTIQQTTRNQIGAAGGISTPSQNTPLNIFENFALKYQGGPYEFDGKAPSTPKNATFTIDLTELLKQSNPADAQRFYLLINDNTPGNPTKLLSYSLIDNIHQAKVDYSSNLPISCDNNSASPYIDYNFYNAPMPDKIPPTAEITSPVNGASLSGMVEVIVKATDNVKVEKVELYVDSILSGTDTTSPYIFALDTTKLSNGTHQLTAVAYDTSGNTASSTIKVNVGNLFGIYVNCGGNTVNYDDKIWNKDNGFTSSLVGSSTLSFINPIYKTDRRGNFSYTFPAINGRYYVTLKFAELVYKKVGERTFSAKINGKTVIPKLDLVKVAGFGKPYDLTFPINVTNKKIKIDFISINNEAKVNGIQITNI